jgi:hypothetical protein
MRITPLRGLQWTSVQQDELRARPEQQRLVRVLLIAVQQKLLLLLECELLEQQRLLHLLGCAFG